MTLMEAIGVRDGTDIKSGEKLTHSEIYGRAIDFLGGLDEVARFVPVPVDAIRQKLKEDPHLNNTKMSLWDEAAGFRCVGADCRLIGGGIWVLYRKHGIDSASNAQCVCLLKEAARRLAANK